jgi:hypothetical protein
VVDYSQFHITVAAVCGTQGAARISPRPKRPRAERARRLLGVRGSQLTRLLRYVSITFPKIVPKIFYGLAKFERERTRIELAVPSSRGAPNWPSRTPRFVDMSPTNRAAATTPTSAASSMADTEDDRRSIHSSEPDQTLDEDTDEANGSPAPEKTMFCLPSRTARAGEPLHNASEPSALPDLSSDDDEDPMRTFIDSLPTSKPRTTSTKHAHSQSAAFEGACIQIHDMLNCLQAVLS